MNLRIAPEINHILVFVWVIVFAGKAILANTIIGEFVFHQHSDGFGKAPVDEYHFIVAVIKHIRVQL